MRNTFINWLVSKAQNDSRIFLLTADLGYSVIEPFQLAFRDRFINVGVAEQNMTGIASGLATEGFLPYTYSIGIFPTFRCAEQIRNDIDYHNLPVLICTVGSGVAYGNLGYSHHAVQDIALMRSMPRMTIATPCDPHEVSLILDWHYQNPCPLYLRLHKAGELYLGPSSSNLSPGQLRKIWPDIESSFCEDKKNYCILTIGHIASKVLRISEQLNSEIPVFSCPVWNSHDYSSLLSIISEYHTILTVEDHVLAGGFGSWIMELISYNDLSVRVVPFALENNVIGCVAKEDTLLQPLLNKFSEFLLNKSNK